MRGVWVGPHKGPCGVDGSAHRFGLGAWGGEGGAGSYLVGEVSQGSCAYSQHETRGGDSRFLVGCVCNDARSPGDSLWGEEVPSEEKCGEFLGGFCQVAVRCF